MRAKVLIPTPFSGHFPWLGAGREIALGPASHMLSKYPDFNDQSFNFLSRSTPVFSAFIAGIPHVLDRNPEWGKEILPLTLQLLLFCPAPEVVNKSRKPNYTLGILETHVRHSWLMTLLIYLYKVRKCV